MKTLSILSSLVILNSCTGKENKPVTPKEKSYTLRLETSEHSAVKRYDDIVKKYEIRAQSDSEAYEKGISTFASWQQAYDTVKTVYLWKSETFSVQDEEGKDVLKRLNESTRQKIQNKFKPAIVTKENIDAQKTNQRTIALKNWRFGMNAKDYNEKETGLQLVGKQMYFFKPLFEDKLGLYKVILEGPETNAKSFETQVRKSVENLHQVFSQQYGTGIKLNSFPSIKSMNKGYIKWLHEWNAGNKNIKVGISELLNGVEFYSVCWITDKELAAANHAIMRNKINDGEKEKITKKK